MPSMPSFSRAARRSGLPEQKKALWPSDLGEHQEELGDAAAEAHHVEHGELLAADLEAEDAQGAAPEVVGGGRAQGQGGDLPQVEPAVEGACTTCQSPTTASSPYQPMESG